MGSTNTIAFARSIGAGLVAGIVGGGAAGAYAAVATYLAGTPSFEQLTPRVVFMVAVGACLLAGALYHRLLSRARKPKLQLAAWAAVAVAGASTLVILMMPRAFGVVAHGAHVIVAVAAATVIPRLASKDETMRAAT